VRAGLDIIAAVAQLETPAPEPLAVRIGIATGVVVVGDLRGENALREHGVGDTPPVAARVQALAEPGTIVVAASTRRPSNRRGPIVRQPAAERPASPWARPELF